MDRIHWIRIDAASILTTICGCGIGRNVREINDCVVGDFRRGFRDDGSGVSDESDAGGRFAKVDRFVFRAGRSSSTPSTSTGPSTPFYGVGMSWIT